MIDSLFELLKAYGENTGLTGGKVNYTIVFFFLLTSIAVSIIYKLYCKTSLWRKQNQLNKDLVPYFLKSEIIEATKNYIPLKYQNVPLAEEGVDRATIGTSKSFIMSMFLNKAFRYDGDDNKFFLVLADSGMGKTSFLINLYSAYQRQWNKPYKIRLFSLGNNASLKDIASIREEEKKNTILLLDAFDEDNEVVKDYKKRMAEIVAIVQSFRKVIITCRPQFFPTEYKEPEESNRIQLGPKGGEYSFQKFYLCAFDGKDIKKYLRKKYNLLNPFDLRKYWKAYSIAQKNSNLMIRPMLLGAIDDLISEEQEFNYSYQLYAKLITVWIDREADKPIIKERYKSVDTYKLLLESFCKNLAVDLYQNRSKRHGLLIYKDEKLLPSMGLQLSDIDEINRELITKESKSRSLLNQNAAGYYKFSHKSILEYFLAKKANDDLNFFRDFNFNGMGAAKAFVDEMTFNSTIKLSVEMLQGTYQFSNSDKIEELNAISFNSYKKIGVMYIAYIPPKDIERIVTNKSNTNIIIDVPSYFSRVAFETILTAMSSEHRNDHFPHVSDRHPELMDYIEQKLKAKQEQILFKMYPVKERGLEAISSNKTPPIAAAGKTKREGSKGIDIEVAMNTAIYLTMAEFEKVLDTSDDYNLLEMTGEWTQIPNARNSGEERRQDLKSFNRDIQSILDEVGKSVSEVKNILTNINTNTKLYKVILWGGDD